MHATEAVEEEFKCYGFDTVEQSVLENVLNFVKAYNTDIEGVVSDLVAFAGNHHDEANLTEQLFNEYKADYLHKKKPATRVKSEPTPPRHELSLKSDQDYSIMAAYGGSPATPLQPSKRLQTTPDNSSSKRRSNIMGTPTPVPNSSPLLTGVTPIRRRESLTPSSKKYTRRTNKSEIVLRHGDVGSVTTWSGSGGEVDITLSRSTSSSAYRYMFQKLQDRAHVLDRRIEELTGSIQQLHTSDIDELSCITEKTTSHVYISGQVCCDCEGRLNTESVLLQGCMNISNGRALPLSISDLPSYSLFPGQTVVLKAHNEDGQRLKAIECFTPEPLPTPQIVDCAGLNLMVACGPFTPDNTNDYAPLTDLLVQVEKSPPDVLILMGPFLNEENHVLQHSVESYDGVFHSILNDILSKTVHVNNSMQLVIVPSHKDLHHDPIYPTPTYHISKNIQNPAVHFVMNPATLDINGVKVGLTAADVLFQMAANEISWDAGTKDRMLRLSEHLLCQRNYFPVYPPNTDINLDLELNEEFGAMNCSPHLLIMSSNFNQFVKAGKKTVFANPGRLCKGEGGGTYMRMVIDPIADSDTIVGGVKAQVIRI